MRCDVCGHRIVPGEHECRNCGYKWKEERVSTYDKDTYHREHNQNNRVTQSRKRSQTKTKTGKSNSIFHNVIVTVLVIMIFAAAIFIRAGISYLSEDYTIEEEYVDAYVDEEDDEAVYVDSEILQREEEIYAFFEELGFADIDTYEYSGDSYSYISVYVYDDDNTHYEIAESYDENGELDYTDFITRGYLSSSIQTGELSIDKNLMNQMGDFLGVDDLYEIIDTYRTQMDMYEDGSYIYFEDNIYLNEEVDAYFDDRPYYYYFSISF